MSEYETLAEAPAQPQQPVDEAQTKEPENRGPSYRPTHPFALAPVAAPAYSVDGFVREFLHELHADLGVQLSRSTVNDQYVAIARTVRNYLMARWLETGKKVRDTKAKQVCYLSAEYLLGRQLGNALLATELNDIADEAMRTCGLDLQVLLAQEVEPGLGNGGLGRLAACFIDSLATMAVPCIGYGIRYEYGIFRQSFVDGRQVEHPDTWLTLGNPWEFPHPEAAVQVNFAGHTERYDDNGVERTRWVPGFGVLGVPYNYMVPGYRNGRVNTLRLWSAQAIDSFDLSVFNAGEYVEAVRAQTFAENITKVLYPEDSTPQGKELRLQQQYFFVACSLKDQVSRLLGEGSDLHTLPQRVIFQLNDTHPVIGIPELMRILIDEQGWEFDDAWATTRECFAYTCHTLLPEALEVWPVELFARLLPRHYEIIDAINAQFLAEVRATYPGDESKVQAMSIISAGPHPAVHMAYLATVGGSKVNGVAELHSQLLRDKVLPDFSTMWPERFTNVTNGVTPRRFIRLANRHLSALISDAIGTGWLTDLERLAELEPYALDPEFRAQFREVKAHNKRRLNRVLTARDEVSLDVTHMLDVMVKRLHEYKRQSLKLLHIVSLYEQVVSGAVPASQVAPRTVIFGAKAAPGYALAKETIYLINRVAEVVNNDARLEGRLKVLFPPNYNVTLAERLIPAADLSEQISLAGKEASGTGNMKLALNGALTIGTEDGANVEIHARVGDDNYFSFGMDEPAVEALLAAGYRPRDTYETNPRLKAAIDLIASGTFSGGNPHEFDGFVGNILSEDRFCALADFESYMAAQVRVEQAYADEDSWSQMAILNVARSGYFSSDRSVNDYIERIWHVPSVR